jgi:hypothetical protein
MKWDWSGTVCFSLCCISSFSETQTQASVRFSLTSVQSRSGIGSVWVSDQFGTEPAATLPTSKDADPTPTLKSVFDSYQSHATTSIPLFPSSSHSPPQNNNDPLEEKAPVLESDPAAPLPSSDSESESPSTSNGYPQKSQKKAVCFTASWVERISEK